MIKSKIYKVDSKGKVREWSISVGIENGVNYYEVSHGQKDGAMQLSKVYVESGKNQGKKNATTACEQCLLEATALWQKQVDRKGYTESIQSEPPNLPMLAHKYFEHQDKITWPAIASTKIDGVRLIITIKDEVVKATSRTGTEIVNIAHITNELLALRKDIVLDGELYSDDHPFEELISIVRKTKTQDPRMGNVYFYAFDIINDKTYHERVVELDHLVGGLKNTKIVPWKILKNEDALLKLHTKVTSEGYEGVMIRNIDSYYQMNKRSYDLLKVKTFLDEEFEIVGWKVGKGKFANVPTFIFKMIDGKTFDAVPKGTEEVRAEYLKNAKKLIGKMATVRYFEFTNDGKPRFGVMLGVRDYE